MKVSTKGRYGIRFMLDLALHANQGTVTLKDVAKRQSISEKYLWQVVTPLKSAGLVKATSGSHGGYMLARKPAQLTVKDILEVLEGNCFLVDCVQSPQACARSADCAARDLWRDLGKKMMQAMQTVTLQDLVEKHIVKQHHHALTYTI